MNKKELHEQRVRGYFIEAAGAILRSEGVKGMNVRSVADKAGYSYGTLYNYFTDISELIFECVNDFQDEIREEIMGAGNLTLPGRVRIQEISRRFVEYFVQHPGIFELFYLEKVTASVDTKPVYTFYDSLVRQDWDVTVEMKVFSGREARVRQRSLKMALVGLMLFYLNRQQPREYSEFRLMVEETLSLSLGEPIQG